MSDNRTDKTYPSHPGTSNLFSSTIAGNKFGDVGITPRRLQEQGIKRVELKQKCSLCEEPLYAHAWNSAVWSITCRNFKCQLWCAPLEVLKIGEDISKLIK